MRQEFSGSSWLWKIPVCLLRSRRPVAAVCEISLDKVGTMVGEEIRESETDGGRERGRVRRSRRDVAKKKELDIAEEFVASIFFLLLFLF